MIRNGLPDSDSDADCHQNVISWSLGHTLAFRKISSKPVGNFFDNAVNPDFGLWTVIRIVTKIELIDHWDMPYLTKKFHQNLFTTFSVIRRTDRLTSRQTDRTKLVGAYARGMLSAGYTINTHKMVARYALHILISPAPHKTAATQQQKTIYSADSHATDTTYHEPIVTVPS